MLFCIPFGGRPDRYPAEKAQPIIHPSGLKEITGLEFTGPNLAAKSTALEALERIGFFAFAGGPEHLVEVTFDHANRGKLADFRPNLPLLFHW